jgi:hypothetical protein
MAEQTHDTRNANNQNPTVRYRFPQYPIPDAAPAAVSNDCPVNMILRKIIPITSAHASVTYTVTIKDSDGFVLSASAAIASGLTGATGAVDFDDDTEVYIPNGATVEVLVSADPNSVETVDLIFIGR